jgi:ferritin-like metal-binding protein YciE
MAVKVGAAMKGVLDVGRGDTAGKNARDGYATEHLEIAAYELLRRVAERAGEPETVGAAEHILRQERAAAEKLAGAFDRAAEASLRAQGVAG